MAKKKKAKTGVSRFQQGLTKAAVREREVVDQLHEKLRDAVGWAVTELGEAQALEKALFIAEEWDERYTELAEGID